MSVLTAVEQSIIYSALRGAGLSIGDGILQQATKQASEES